jgi:type I restriction enzyme S subunit
MREGWNSTTWGEVATLEYGKSLKDYQNSSGDVPVFGTNGPIGFTDKPLCNFPSVIIGRKGAYRGVHYSKKPFFVIDTAFYLKPKTDDIDLLFAYYQLLTQDINIMDSGSAIPSTSREDFYNLEINLPPLATQHRIAAILSALDDKIEMNSQTNQTLEAIAQNLFKEWFVGFNFPGVTGEMQESELGPIPVGWRVGKLEDIVSIKHGFAFKGDYFSEEETDDILVTPGNFRIGGGFNYSKFKYYDGLYPSEYLLNRGDLIITMTDLSKEGDTLGYPALVPQIYGKKLLHNQRVGKIEFGNNSLLKMYLYFVMCQIDYRNYVLSGATGTTVRHTSPGRVCDYMLVIPPAEMLRQFEERTQSLIDNIEFSFLQNQTLAQTRDTLLPKLMNGEIVA